MCIIMSIVQPNLIIIIVMSIIVNWPWCSHPVAVSCPVLSSPENGVVDVADRTLGNMATYTCNIGHVLVGSELEETFRTCMADAMWSDDDPVCIGT